MDSKGNKVPSKPSDKTEPLSSDNNTNQTQAQPNGKESAEVTQLSSKDKENSKEVSIPANPTQTKSKDTESYKDNTTAPNQTQLQPKEKVDPKEISVPTNPTQTKSKDTESFKENTTPPNQTQLQPKEKVDPKEISVPTNPTQTKSKDTESFKENTIPPNQTQLHSKDKVASDVPPKDEKGKEHKPEQSKQESLHVGPSDKKMKVESKSTHDAVDEQKPISLACSAEEHDKILQLERLTGIHDLAFCKNILEEHQWNVELAIEKQFRKAYPSAYHDETRGFWSTFIILWNFLFSVMSYPFRIFYQLIESFFERQSDLPPATDDAHVSGVESTNDKTSKESIKVLGQSFKKSSVIECACSLEQIKSITSRCVNCSYGTTGTCLNSNLPGNSTSFPEPETPETRSNPILCICKKILDALNMNCSIMNYSCECDARKILLFALIIFLWIGCRPASVWF